MRGFVYFYSNTDVDILRKNNSRNWKICYFSSLDVACISHIFYPIISFFGPIESNWALTFCCIAIRLKPCYQFKAYQKIKPQQIALKDMYLISVICLTSWKNLKSKKWLKLWLQPFQMRSHVKRVHKKIEGTHTCHMCPKKYHSKQRLISHINGVHLNKVIFFRLNFVHGHPWHFFIC